MSSPISLFCYDRVSTQHDYPDTFHDIPIQRHEPSTINFDLKLYVRFEKRCCCCGKRIIDVFNIPQLLSSHYISCEEFFRNGPSFLTGNFLFHDVITNELLDDLIPGIMFSVRESLPSNIYDLEEHLSISEDGLALIPLVIGLVIELPADVDIEEVAEIILIGYGTQEVKMIPASEEVIRSLDKVVLPEGFDDSTQCCICLENFKERMEVSAIACRHFFHHGCVVRWLKTSHTCPLCRYPMPRINSF